MYISLYVSGKIYREVNNMFEVKKEEYVNKTFRMPAGLVKTLEEVAQREKVSLNKLVVQCCEYSLANMKETQ